VRVMAATGRDVRTSHGVRIGVDDAVTGLPGTSRHADRPGQTGWRGAVADTALGSGHGGHPAVDLPRPVPRYGCNSERRAGSANLRMR
jgi:hypothetical protein